MAELIINPQTEGGAAADMKASGKPKAAAGTLVVCGPADGRWRAGRYFTRKAQTLEAATLTAAEIAEIEADPLLSVKRG